MSDPFLAEIRMVGFNFVPLGWALCDGQLLPISQNTALFSLLGTNYGGNGLTTFALPNLQGRVPIHSGQGPGLRDRQLGETGGSATVTLTTNQIPTHFHVASASTGRPTARSPVGNVLAGSRSIFPYIAPTTSGIQTTPMASSSAQGGSQPHNNMQPYLVVLFVIALQGVYPPRA